MDDISELVSGLGILIVSMFAGIYGFILWGFYRYRSFIPEFYQTYTIQDFLLPIVRNNFSLILPLFLGYIFTVFYLARGNYHKQQGKNYYPKSQVLVEITNRIQFLMPVYFSSLLLALYPQESFIMTIVLGFFGLSIYLVFRLLSGQLVTGGWISKLIGGIFFIGLFIFGFTSKGIIAEISIMGIVTAYTYIVDSAPRKYYELFTKNYEMVAENYLKVNNATRVWESEEDIADSLYKRLQHQLISGMRNVDMIKGGNFVIIVALAFFLYSFNLSAISLLFLLTLYPLLVIRIPLLDYSPVGPVNILGKDYEAVFITDENDQDGYYTIVAPEGEKKLRADSIEGYETYEDGETAVRKKLDD